MAAALEEDIIFGRLPPGTALREERLLERFGASRHVVRDALAQLEAKQVVVRTRNRGAVVRVLSAEEVRELHEVREVLQRQAALRIRLPVPPNDIAPIAAIQAEYEARLMDGDVRGTHDANDRFHDALFALCGNRHLQGLIRQLLHLSYLVRTRDAADAEDRAQAMAEHRLMVAQLHGTDGWALAELCVAHIRPRRDAYLAFLASLEKPRRRRASSPRR
jgi:DNA-binding GntR family transcriptional regulator